MSRFRYLVGLALPRTRAHGIHPQVGVHVIGADPRVGVDDMRQDPRLVLHPHCRARHEPDPPWKQHPPHVQSAAQPDELKFQKNTKLLGLLKKKKKS